MLLTDCNAFVFILCKIIYVLLGLNVQNIHIIHTIKPKGSKDKSYSLRDKPSCLIS